MGAPSPKSSEKDANVAKSIGTHIRERRQALGINAVITAEAAGLSRMTLYRIERGETSVTLGAYLNVLSALGLSVDITDSIESSREALKDHRVGWIPTRIRLVDYPVLRQLAWQVHGTDELTPREALGIYERNWRHIDTEALSSDEQSLVDALQLVFQE